MKLEFLTRNSQNQIKFQGAVSGNIIRFSAKSPFSYGERFRIAKDKITNSWIIITDPNGEFKLGINKSTHLNNLSQILGFSGKFELRPLGNDMYKIIVNANKDTSTTRNSRIKQTAQTRTSNQCDRDGENTFSITSSKKQGVRETRIDIVKRKAPQK